MSEDFDYSGRDLEAMSFAFNYHRWILRLFSPFLGTRVVEVGAGAGAFSELILRRHLHTLALVEPSKRMFDILKGRLEKWRSAVRVTAYNSFFSEVAGEINATQPDSVIYVNVLEHIADDEAELEVVRHTLRPSGRIFIFVPALRWLYGEFDRRVGHYRRYHRRELESKCRLAGFKIIESRYCDLAGVIPWWMKYRFLRSDKLEPQTVKLYDRYAVPAVKALESILRPPLGKNILLVGEKIW